MKDFRQRVGVCGEEIAAAYLQQCGFQILERNYRSQYGEIDLIARSELSGSCPDDANTENQPLTVFVEVKTRRSLKYGFPEQAVTPKKRGHLLAAVQEYIQQNPEIRGDWRIDVIAIIQSKAGSPPEIQVFENAITAE